MSLSDLVIPPWVKPVAIGVVVLGLGIYIGTLKLELGSAQGTVAKQKGEIAQWSSAYDVLSKATVAQNAAVNQLKVDSDKKHVEALQAIKKADELSVSQQNLVTAIALRDKSVTGTQRTCEAAVLAAKGDLH